MVAEGDVEYHDRHAIRMQWPADRYIRICTGPKKPIYAIRPGASGDITLLDNMNSSETVAWCRRQSAPYNPSTLAYHDRLYVLYDQGFLACFNANDGSDVYRKQRLRSRCAFTSSPWASNEKSYCLNEDGITWVLDAGDNFNVVRTNKLAEDDMCMATPAIVADRLLLRTSARLYCIRSDQNSVGRKILRLPRAMVSKDRN